MYEIVLTLVYHLTHDGENQFQSFHSSSVTAPPFKALQKRISAHLLLSLIHDSGPSRTQAASSFLPLQGGRNFLQPDEYDLFRELPALAFLDEAVVAFFGRTTPRSSSDVSEIGRPSRTGGNRVSKPSPTIWKP